MTRGSCNPGGNGSGSRSAGTGASPTLPPRLPLSPNSELAGTLISTPASAGFAASTEGLNVMRVGFNGADGLERVTLNERQETFPDPPARLFVRPASYRFPRFAHERIIRAVGH